MKRLSIVILTCNQKVVTIECLRVLQPLIERDEFEVIIVDNGSTDDTIKEIGIAFPSVKIIRNESNLGVSKGRNQGYHLSSSEFVLQLDNDTIPYPDTILRMLTYAEDNARVGIVTCRMFDGQGVLLNNCRPYPGILEKLKSVFRMSKYSYTESECDGILNTDGGYIIGACQLIRKNVLEKVGYLDEHIFYGPEDADICIRIYRSGYYMKYLADVSIVHYYARMTKRRPYSRLAFNHFKALLYFYNKYSRWV